MTDWFCSPEATEGFRRTGSAGGNGTLLSPWPIQSALETPQVDSMIQPGDTVHLVSGRYSLKDAITVRRIGMPGKPIRIRSEDDVVLDWTIPTESSDWVEMIRAEAPPEAASLPPGSRVVQTTIAPEMTPGIGSAPYDLGGIVTINGTAVALLEYREPADFFSPDQRWTEEDVGTYLGPGVYFHDQSTAYVRLDPPDQSVISSGGGGPRTGSNPSPWSANGVDAGDIELCWTRMSGGVGIVGLTFRSSHLIFENARIRNAGATAIGADVLDGVLFDGLRIETPMAGVLLSGGGHHVTIRNCELDGMCPGYVSFADAKTELASNPPRFLMSSVVSRGIDIAPPATDILLEDNRIRNFFDGLGVFDNGQVEPNRASDRVRILRQVIEGATDDSINLGSGSTDIEVSGCRVLRCFSGISTVLGVRPPDGHRPGTVFIHHNLIDLVPQMVRRRRRETDDAAVFRAGSAFSTTHGRFAVQGAKDAQKIYQNTVRVRADRDDPVNYAPPVGTPYRGVPNGPAASLNDMAIRTQEVFNNIFIQHSNVPVMGDPPVLALTDGHDIFDGNVYWWDDGQPWALWASTIAELRADDALVERTAAVHKCGWEASGREGDKPSLVDWRPAVGSVAASGGVNLRELRPTWPGVTDSTFAGAFQPLTDGRIDAARARIEGVPRGLLLRLELSVTHLGATDVLGEALTRQLIGSLVRGRIDAALTIRPNNVPITEVSHLTLGARSDRRFVSRLNWMGAGDVVVTLVGRHGSTRAISTWISPRSTRSNENPLVLQHTGVVELT